MPAASRPAGLAHRVNGALRGVPPWLIYLAAPVPVVWLFVRAVNGSLGVDPLKAVEHSLGLYGLQVIIAVLFVTPLRWSTGINLIRFRRPLGLVAFFYVVLHFAVWVALDLQFRWAEIGADLTRRPYIVIGFTGFLLMLPLAMTSNNASIRWLGAAGWQRLHRLIYLAALAGVIHFVWLRKTWQEEPLIYLGLVVALLAVRLWRRLGWRS